MQPRRSTSDARTGWGWRRALAVLLGCVLLALLLSSDTVHAALKMLLEATEPIVRGHPLLGMVVFVALSALSAMLAFFSSAPLVPAAVQGFGVVPAVGLLWLGWFIGGLGSFAIGRVLRRPLVRSQTLPKRFENSLVDLSPGTRFIGVLLLQLTLPSELPGYLCGALGIRVRVYAAALALAELPYATGTVLIGASVVQRQRGWLLLLGVFGAAGFLIATRLLRTRLKG